MSVSYAIQAHPSRLPLVLDLLGELGDVPVAWSRQMPDVLADTWDTRRRALLEATGDFHCVIQDDAILCKNFRERCEQVVEAGPEYVYGLFYRHKSQFPAEAEAAIRGVREGYFTTEGHLFGVGVITPAHIIEPLVSFGDGIDKRGDDYRMKRFCIVNGIQTLFPLPSLVDHRREPSLVGHNGVRKAWKFG